MVHGQWWLENCSQHCLKRMEADSLSSAVEEVKKKRLCVKNSFIPRSHVPVRWNRRQDLSLFCLTGADNLTVAEK